MLVVAGGVAVGAASAGADPFCDLIGFVFPGSPSASLAVLQYDKSLNQVAATVSLKRALPNTTYFVRILQGDDTSCFTDLGSVTTNGQGNGSINVSAPATGTEADAFVWDETGFGSSDYFASAPTFYNHT